MAEFVHTKKAATTRLRFLLGLSFLLLLLFRSAFSGTISGSVQTATGGVIANGTLTFNLSHPAVLSGTATIATQSSNCYTSTAGNVVGLPDPLALPVVTTNTASGTLAAGTYFVKLTYWNASGETVASPESVAVLTGAGSLIINAPVLQPTSATGYKVYISATSGTETLQSTVTGFGQYTQSSGLSSGTALPASNTSACSLYFSDQLIPTGTYYTVSLVSKNGSTISGYPQTWCTFGGQSGTINVSQGVPTGNCNTNGVIYPTPILSNPQNNAQQSINGPLVVTGNFSGKSINGIFYVDGVTFPFTAAGVQAAINAACNGTTLGVVVITPGNINLLTTGQSAPSNCVISGSGQASTTLTLSSSAVTTHFVNASSTPTNIQIRDITLDGGSGTSLSEGCVGMNQVTTPTDITIERVTCQNVGGSGFNVTGTTANPGKRIKVVNSKVINACLNTFSGGTQCYGILASNNSHVTVTDNEITGGNITAGIVAFSGVNASSATPIVDVQVIGNRVHDLTQAITTGAGIDVGRARQVVASGNAFYNIVYGGCVTFEAVWGGSMANNVCSVADSVLTGGPFLVKTPDTTQTGEVASQDISITGNSVIDNSGASTTNADIGVNGAQRGITISGNSISHLTSQTAGGSPIHLQLGTNDANISAASQNFCNNISVSGNTVTNRGSAGSTRAVQIVQVNAACTPDQLEIYGNVINGWGTGIYWTATGNNGITHMYVHDNALEGNTTGMNVDSNTYATVFYWKNNPPSGSGLLNEYKPLPMITNEVAAPTGLAGSDELWPDSTSHRWKMNNNNGGPDVVVGAATTDSFSNKSFGSGSVLNFYKLATDTPGAITVNAGTCTDRTVTVTGLATTGIIAVGAAYALDANIIPVGGQAASGTAHYRLCNPTAGNITLNAAAAFNIGTFQ